MRPRWLWRLGLLALVPAFGAADAAPVPSSDRSREAVARVKPALEQALEAKGLKLGSPVFMRIFKESSELEVWVRGKQRFELFRVYPICTYSGALGPKEKQGDGQAPEGFYTVAPRQMNPMSSFHLSFNLGYPNAYDRAYERTGSALMVHGNCVSIGCYAMTDPLIEEIWTLADAALRGGQSAFQVHIFPFRMTKEAFAHHQDSAWKDFWANLQEGYDLFEQSGVPPQVGVHRKHYTFSP